MTYAIKLEFDIEDETPQIFIVDERGMEVVEVFDEAKPLTEEWSWDESDWDPGEFAREIVARMNARPMPVADSVAPPR